MIGRYLRQLRNAINDVQPHGSSASSRRGRLWQLTIAADMLASSIQYGASPNNYVAFGWFNSPRNHRRTFFTHRDNARLIRRFNSDRAVEIFTDKLRFNEEFKPYLGRRFLDLASSDLPELGEFLLDSTGYLLKPRREGQGRGITVFPRENVPNIRSHPEALSELLRQGGILEEMLESHPALLEAFGAGLLPVRLITLVRDGRSHIVMAAVTLGGMRTGRVVNLHTGGWMAPVDVTAGRIEGPAVDKCGLPIRTHPETGTPFEGFILPFWDEAVSLAHRLAKVIPEAGFVGWDIGITPNGPVVVEGNTDPGTYVSLQRPIFSAFDGGLRSRLQPFLDPIPST
jgi:hypothetical protein